MANRAAYKVIGANNQPAGVVTLSDEYTTPLANAAGVSLVTDEDVTLPRISKVGEAIRSGLLVRLRVRVRMDSPPNTYKTQHLLVSGYVMPGADGAVLNKPIGAPGSRTNGGVLQSIGVISSATVPRRRKLT